MNRIGRLLTAGVCLVLILGIFGVAAWAMGSTGPSVKIGICLPLTGDFAPYGRALKNGIDLAIKDALEQDGITIEAIYEDDQGKPSTAVSAVTKLITLDKVPVIIGGAASALAEAIIPVTEKNSVLLVSPTATKPSLTDNTKYFFRLWPSDNYDGKVMAEMAYKKLGLHKVAILYVNVAYGQGITEVFSREFEKLGGKVLLADGYAQGSTDFRTQIERIRGTAPEAVFLPGYAKEVSIILRQAKELAFKPRFLGVNTFYDKTIVEASGDAVEGAVFTYPTFDVLSADADASKFVRSFREKYKSEPNAFAVQGYDSARVLAKALARTRTVSASDLRQSFLELKYKGPGGEVRFLATGDVEKPLRLMVIKGGNFIDLP